MIGMPLSDWDTAKRFINEWVMGPVDRAAYVERYVEIFGQKLLDDLMVKSPIVPEQPAKSGWR